MSAAGLGRVKTTCKDLGLQPILGRRRRRPITGSSQIEALGKPAFGNRRPERRNRSCGQCAVSRTPSVSPNRIAEIVMVADQGVRLRKPPKQKRRELAAPSCETNPIFRLRSESRWKQRSATARICCSQRMARFLDSALGMSPKREATVRGSNFPESAASV